MTRLTYGVGYNSKRDHQTTIDGKPTIAYSTWHSMMSRCYDQKTLKRSPTYIGCNVADDWHDYQDFADWFYSHNYSSMGYQLDKDLILPNNKIYSSSTCAFVPHELNSLLLVAKSLRGEFPQGVYMDKRRDKLMAIIRINGERRFLGVFDCPDEAHQAYKLAKERHVKNKALEWANRIEWNVFVALMNWTLDS